MSVVLARVDDRLVHGQVVEGWVPHVSADIVVVASDKIFLDQGRCRLLTLIVPEHLGVMIVPLRKLAKLLHDMIASNIVLLFEDLGDVLAVLEMGVALDRINVGNLHHLRGGIEVTPSVYLNRKDFEMVRNLSGKGIKVEAREVPGSKSFDLMEFIAHSKDSA
jgi:mannose/fructose/N-acetylgalactosamine-specific phosphotransferase system component IIB